MATKDKLVTLEDLGVAYSDVKADLTASVETCANTIIPPAYKTANYQNAAATNVFKWKNNFLHIYHKNNAGSISSGIISNSSASLALNDNISFDVSNFESGILRFWYAHNNAGTITLSLRFYNSSYSSSTSISIPLVPTSGKVMAVDVIKEAFKQGIDFPSKPKMMIRDLGWTAHTATEVEEISVKIYGFTLIPKGDVKPTNKIDFSNKPWIAHLFINTVADSENETIVPSQSRYDIEISKRLGFRVIEVNTHVLSDGNYIALHGDSGKFGLEFVAAPDSTYTDTQIQETAMSSVSLDWVKTNVRYKAKYPKMRTAPLSYQEFLYACKKNNMIPTINCKEVAQIPIADKIMGKDNYILYGAPTNSRYYTNAVLLNASNLTSKADIVNAVKRYGTPYIICAVDYTKFSLTDWKDIVDTVHQMGAMINFAGGYMTPAQAQNLLDLGFDFGSSGWDLNPCNSGNLCNLSADTGFNSFSITNGTESNAEVELDADGTITLANALSSHFLTGNWLDITFTGNISVSMGRFITHDKSSMSADEPRTVHLSTYMLNSAPSFVIKGGIGGAIIHNIVFKASSL